MRGFLIAMCILVLMAAAGYGGYKYGHQKGVDSVDKAEAVIAATSSKLPAVTPLETTRNVISNFYSSDTAFVKIGYQDSRDLSTTFIGTINDNQRKQISIAKAFFCVDEVPQSMSFTPEPIADNATTTVVKAEATLKDSSKVKPSYVLIIQDDRWKINSVTCPAT
jgi:hypothetical protein